MKKKEEFNFPLKIESTLENEENFEINFNFSEEDEKKIKKPEILIVNHKKMRKDVSTRGLF